MDTQISPFFSEYLGDVEIDAHTLKQITPVITQFSQEYAVNQPLYSSITIEINSLRSTPNETFYTFSIPWLDNSVQNYAGFVVRTELNMTLLGMLFLFTAILEWQLRRMLLQYLNTNKTKQNEQLPIQSNEPSPDVSIDQMTMVLNTEDFSALLNDKKIELTKTQFIYLLWYSQKRISKINDGWVLNPSSTKPSESRAAELITLMERFSGHRRALQDLKKYGLRAKTLDQNRNKIKEVSHSALAITGKSWSLFDCERDEKSGRYRHRISLSHKNVTII